MKLLITLPEQQKDEVEIEGLAKIVVDVIAFYSSDSHPYWSLNPKCLPFANFPDDFKSLTLSKTYNKNVFQLAVAYEVEDETNCGNFTHDVLLEVVSVEEVEDYPSPIAR